MKRTTIITVRYPAFCNIDIKVDVKTLCQSPLPLGLKISADIIREIHRALIELVPPHMIETKQEDSQ